MGVLRRVQRHEKEGFSASVGHGLLSAAGVTFFLTPKIGLGSGMSARCVSVAAPELPQPKSRAA